MKAHKYSLVNRRLGNCNLLVLVVIIAHLFQKVNNLQKKNYAFLFICYSSRNLLDLDKFHACMEIWQISRTKWTPVHEQNKVAKQRKHVSAVLWMGVPWTFLGLSFHLFNTFRVFLYKLSRHHDLVIASTAANTKVYSNTQNFPFLASAWVRFFHDNSISNLKIHFHTPKTGL